VSFAVATAGKGGTGKTTVAALCVRYLMESGRRPVLAVDADADGGLADLLGMPEPKGLGQVREQMRQAKGMSKAAFIEAGVARALEEGNGFDLLAMGRPEGPGCYCAANTLLSKYLDQLAGNYPWVVIDNEAGLEHISRLVTRRLDVMLVVSDASRRGLRAAARIRDLAREVGLNVGRMSLLVNRVRGELSPALLAEAEGLGLGPVRLIPDDPLVAEAEATGVALVTGLKEESPALRAVYKVLSEALSGELPQG
jgi:CO dehydrogenase maturation factor